MLAIKGIYENGKISLSENLKNETNARNVVVLFIDEPLDKNTISADTLDIMKATDETGFIKNVLGDPAEDVWNDL